MEIKAAKVGRSRQFSWLMSMDWDILLGEVAQSASLPSHDSSLRSNSQIIF